MGGGFGIRTILLLLAVGAVCYLFETPTFSPVFFSFFCALVIGSQIIISIRASKGVTHSSLLNPNRKLLRALIGVLLSFIALFLWFSTSPTLQVLSALDGWFALSFIVASITGYDGCPEIGAVPSLLLSRPILTS